MKKLTIYTIDNNKGTHTVNTVSSMNDLMDYMTEFDNIAPKEDLLSLVDIMNGMENHAYNVDKLATMKTNHMKIYARNEDHYEIELTF